MSHSPLGSAGRSRGRSLRVEPLEDRRVLSATLEMLTDVGSTPHGGSSNPHRFVEVGELVYFMADSGPTFSEELWVTDGTTNGTRSLSSLMPANLLVGDIRGNVAGTLYFSASETGPSGHHLWKWEGFGTDPKPVLSADGNRIPFITQFGSVFVTQLAEVNGVWYFGAGGQHSELWRTDGTQAGTFRVKTLRTDGFAFAQTTIYNVDGTLLFAADDGAHGNELWTSDGTEAGTVLVKDVNPGSLSGVMPHAELRAEVVVGDVLYFNGSDQSGDWELWRSDGTADGTFRVKDVVAGAHASDPRYLTNVDGVLYFSARNSYWGEFELWKSDGTEAGTAAIPIATGAPFNMTEMNGKLYFGAGTTLWRTDGTAAGTTAIGRSDLPQRPLALPRPTSLGASYSDSMVNFNGTLYFLGGDVSYIGMWKLNEGDAVASYVAGDYLPNPTSLATLEYLAIAGDKLYFSGRSSSYNIEPWVSDGTVAGTRLLKDISGSSTSSGVGAIVNANGTIQFVANTEIAFPSTPRGWWTSDGTIAGTTSYVQIPGVLRSHSILGVAGGLTFYKSTNSRSDADWELWRTDGTAAGTFRVKDILPGAQSGLGVDKTESVEMNGFLYFRANDGVNGFELWRSDGTEAGTTMVVDLNPGPESGVVWTYGKMVNVGGTLYFVGSDSVNRYALWKTDGTAAGTSLVRNFLGGSPIGFHNVNGTLYFAGDDVPTELVLWKSDGTAEGTVMVQNVERSVALSPGDVKMLYNIGDTVYFIGSDGIHGRELWKSDGTNDGTMVVKDIRPDGNAFTAPAQAKFTVVGDTLFFLANDGVAGTELWKSDGTEAGTVLVKDIQPGAGSSNLGAYAMPVDVNGILYFSARTSANGTELWRSDGTAAGTYLVRDLNPTLGGAGNSPDLLTNVNGSLYFTANDGTHGQELWVLRPEVAEPLAGDYNNDGRVDGADFLAWQRGYGSATTPAGSGADGDADGTIAAGDLDVWKGSYGATAAVAAAAMAASDAPASVAAALMASEAFEEGALDGDGLQTTARDRIFAAGDFSRLYTTDGEQNLVRERWRRRR